MSQNFHSAPELIFKLFRRQITQCPHGAKRFLTQNCIFREKTGVNELLSSVINVSGCEDTLCCVRASSVHWFPTACSSWDKQMSSFVTCLPHSWTAVSSPRRAGPGDNVSISIRIQTTSSVTVYTRQSLCVTITFCELTNSFRGQHIPWTPHFLDKSTKKRAESDGLNFKGWATGCRRKVIRHADW